MLFSASAPWGPIPPPGYLHEAAAAMPVVTGEECQLVTAAYYM